MMAKFLNDNKSVKQFEKELFKYNILPLPKQKYMSKKFLDEYRKQEYALKRRFVSEYRKAFIRKNSTKTQS